MWQVDEKDYLKRVLGPAVVAFNSEGRRPDLFERYDLPLDVKDAADIEKALTTIPGIWNKRRQNARDKQLVSILVGQKEQDEARRVLIDANARGALRKVVMAERQQRIEARYRLLDESIAIVAGKGYITATELAALQARFGPQGIGADELTARVRVPVREAASRLPSDEGLPQVVRNQIRANLAVLGKRDLYDFLGVPPDAERALLTERYHAVEQEWRPRAADFRKTAANDLLGIIKSNLIDGDPARYAAALTWEIVEKLRHAIELPAADKVITRSEFSALLAFAASIGLSERTATEYILALAQDPKIGASVEWTAAGDSIRCAHCSSFMARNGGAACTICGGALYCDCPRCKTRVPASNPACSQCGFKLAELATVELLTRMAELYLEDGKLGESLAAARDAEQRWGRQGRIETVLDNLEAKSRALKEQLGKLAAAVDARKLVAARALLAALPGHHGELQLADGRTVETLAASISKGLAGAEARLQTARELERAGKSEDAVFACLDALAICVDFTDAQQVLRRFPPAPARAPKAVQSNGQVLLQWSASSALGEVSYTVVRREDRPLVGADDGECVAVTQDTHCRDTAPPIGAVLSYGVIAQRGGIAAPLVLCEPLLVTKEVDKLTLEAGDGVVTGSFCAPPRARVRVLRRADSPADSAASELRLSGPGAFADREVTNGCVYQYRLVCEFTGPGATVVRTAGVTALAQPDAPPPAIEDLQLTANDSGLELRFGAPRKGVGRVYRAPQPPPWPSGTVIPAAGLARLGPVLSLRSLTVAVDPAPPPGLSFYLPVTLAGDHATIGSVHRYAAIADVSGLQVEDFGSYALLRWSWPAGCSQVVLAFGSATFPVAPDDPRATCRRITRAEYDRNGGFHLDNPDQAPHFFAVFAVGQVEGEPAFAPGISPGARAVVREKACAAVSYSIHRQWLRRRLTLELRTDLAVEPLPPLVLVAKPGELQPLQAEDGTVLCQLLGERLVPGAPLVREVDVKALRTPAYLRAFFVGAAAPGRCRLVDPPREQLKVR